MLFNRTDKTNRLSKPWSKGEDDHLLFLRDEKRLEFYAIAERLHRTKSACRNHYYKVKKQK